MAKGLPRGKCVFTLRVLRGNLTLVLSSTLPEWSLVKTGRYWNWYFHNPANYTGNLKSAVDALASFADSVNDYYSGALGYSLPKPNPRSAAGDWMVHVDELNTNIGGGAGAEGIGLTGGAVLDTFWSLSFTAHEIMNIFTGIVTAGWPWADGSEIWRALDPRHSPYVSPFPYAASIMVLNVTGHSDIASRKISDASGDLGVSLLYGIMQNYGWTPFKALMETIRLLQIDLASLTEPLKTAVIMVIMAVKTGIDFISMFNATFVQAGVAIAQSIIDAARLLIITPPPIDIQIHVQNQSGTPVPNASVSFT